MSESDQRFRPTNGTLTGWAGIAVAAAVIGYGAVVPDSGVSPTVVASAVLVGVVVWMAMLRPHVALRDDTLVLVNMVRTTMVPLAAVTEVVVRQVLVVKVGDRRVVSPTIGRSRRQVGRDDRARRAPDSESATDRWSPGAAIEERIRRGAEDARDRRGIRNHSEEQESLAAEVIRRTAWPEVAALVGSVTAVVLTAVL